MNRIDSVRIHGFRSLADVRLSERPGATVLIGANGAGKSNFICFFEMMGWMLTRFRTLDPGEYRRWLDESFTSGELRQKNLIGGRP